MFKIISRFSDYYDRVSTIPDYEPGLCYVRETSDQKLTGRYLFERSLPNITLGGHVILHRGHWDRRHDINGYDPCYVGFCGKMYAGWYPLDHRVMKTRVIFRRKELEADIESRLWKPVKDLSTTWHTNMRQRITRRSPHFFPDEPIIIDIGDAIFEELNAPCFFIPRDTGWDCTIQGSWIEGNQIMHVIKNPNLRDLGFSAIMDAATANQEIERYLTNQLAPKSSLPVTISDKSMLFKKGFDDRSFKKDKKAS